MTSCVMVLRLRTDLTSQLGILKAHPILTTSGIRLSGLTSEGRKVLLAVAGEVLENRRRS